MSLALPSAGTVLRKAGDAALSVNAMVRGGLFNPLRPDIAARSALSMLKFGPFAGAVVHGANTNAKSAAIVDEGGELTFEQLDQMSNAFARGLAAQGLGPGDVVGVLCRDHRGMVLTLAAAGKLGVRAVLMNTGFAKPQFTDVAAREQVKAVLHDSEFFDLMSAIPADIPRILTWVDAKDNADPSTPTIESVSAGQSTDPVTPPEKPGGMVILTSGTTGTPKGAPRDKVSPFITAQFLDRIPLPRNSTVVMAAPIFHATGLSQFTLSLALGNRVVFQQRRFDPEGTLANIQKFRAQGLTVVPTMLQRILDLPEETLAKYNPAETLKVVFAAGSAIPPDVVTRTLDYFGDSLYNVYGSTECAVMTVAQPHELRKAPTTAGKPPVGIRVALFDENRNRISAPNVTGTIFIENGHSFKQYTDGRTKEYVEGLMSSGDVGHFDTDGLLFIDGRDDDMIVSGGENVFPQEVENLLSNRPDVLEAAVVGVDDRDFGKRLRAIVVPGPDSKRDVQEIKDYVKENLARYKVPREVIFLDELPHNATGKLLRKPLIEMDVTGN
ncbi:acyl-CoA synthetase [Nocardia seriolae]|uniref:Acyl-CoA synthetase n=2 Tax=Nocardia seriolae TaxID=37332 RepID=A0A0B8NF58_9NOCA|nr:acyl-CoA synthetase [Nocardia seriolae]MTJ61649.1 AMP-binding protein [Nocardia seriolae]MTJ76086.1 AMP-binding protein [Nocardia seriolae]MTJ86667.1 AMP-binding protein [Nocardia seriolae]MTK30662.1 AMP-binding protein [Nocardia seriolae]MTK39616.1 AMP-binding protein [Nocardia seriolae]